ncbi:hypothetical protein SAMN02745221_01961 [Thermosyntropha lipolytica DSM 11003]|uniref:Amidohydrolase 3 domain-containing protein n=1 Tax=Thermosyntropha lipolytica DSM 11003 TaxID=1123382 RepID=A0A1M5R7E1_9FIRM|nr:amidohydrolase family protein [Thermosyntropha lipolytica]SHH22285.1 hypothetical protein SAMN02745221_01961 [Thermosyntropha lipolytica DSM 11003]
MQVFGNGVFISCDEEDNVYSYMVVDRGEIVFLGDRLPEKYKGVKDYVDLEGKAVIPLMADTHVHFGSFALFNFGLDVRYAQDFDEMRQIIEEYEKRQKGKSNFLMGFGVSAHTVKEKKLPCRDDLDKMTRLPLLIVKYDGHAAVANSALVKKFPEEVKKAEGFEEDTGWLYMDAFYKGVNFVSSFIKPFSLIGKMIQAADYMAKEGIGLIHAVEGNGFKNDADFDAVNFITRAFPQYFRLYLQTMDVNKARKRRLSRIGGCFATALDGCLGSEDAALLSPYSNNPANYGKLFYSQEEVNAFVQKAHRAHLQIALHAIGDAAIEQALNAFEAAIKDYPRFDHRHIIIHADLINKDQIVRAAELKIHLAVQPAFLHWREEPASYLEYILGDRAKKMLPFRDMFKAGLVLGGGSDAPCTLPHPLEGIGAACNHPDPEQRLNVREALKMYTSWAARLSFDEDITGTLKAGRRADFAVLDRNILGTAPEEIKDIKVWQTYFQGNHYKGLPFGPGKAVIRALLRRNDKCRSD